MTFKVYGSDGSGSITSTPVHFSSYTTTVGQINLIMNGRPPPNSSLQAILDSASQSNASLAILYTDEATGSQRWRDMQAYTKANMTPKDFVAVNLPSDRFYIDRTELENATNGNGGIRSYASDMAAILFNHSSPQPPGDVAMLEQILHYEVDGNYANGEVCHNFDPLNWTAGVRVRFYESTQNCTKVTDFNMDADGCQLFYDLFKNDILPALVAANPDYYGYPDNPRTTWGTQDSNSP